MAPMRQRLVRFWRSADAATAVEYAVVLAMILMIVFAAVVLLGQKTAQSWNTSNTSIQTITGS